MLSNVAKLLFFIAFVGTCKMLTAQNVEADSLRRILDTVGENHQKVITLESLSYAYQSAYPDTALQYAMQGLQLSRQIDDRVGEAYCTDGLGNVYFAVSDYPNALDMYFQSLKLKESLKNEEHGIGVTYFNIANVYTEQAEYEHALKYLFKAKIIDEKLKDTGGILFDLYSLGSIYLRMKKTDSALLYTERSYQLALQLHDENLIGAIVNNYGEIYFSLKDYKQAEKKYRLSIEYAKVINDNEVLTADYYGLAKVFKEENNIDSSIAYARHALDIARSASFLKQVLEVSTFLSGLYKATNQFDSAFHYQELSIATKDSLFNVEKIQKLQSLKMQEQQRQQDIEVTKIKYRNKINLYAVIFASVIFLFIAALLWRTNRQKRRDYNLLQQQKLKTDEALQELKATQTQLLQKEKMASLGELTAGIAHEIKNPLNFINNFAELNAELLDELKEKINNNEATTEDHKDIHEDLKQNLEKIIHHGKRADSIVKNMLEHSRMSDGIKIPTDINALVAEYLNLSYHGIRARDKSFNATMTNNLDPALSQPEGLVNIVPQDIGRVLLNLFNNAFYAVNEKNMTSQRKTGSNVEDVEYIPTVTVSTIKKDHKIKISILDNGNGISEQILNKIFQPFYTTKPTGEGTGLGLSLSYDIITKTYGGELTVNTKEGEYAEFIIELPI